TDGRLLPERIPSDRGRGAGAVEGSNLQLPERQVCGRGARRRPADRLVDQWRPGAGALGRLQPRHATGRDGWAGRPVALRALPLPRAGALPDRRDDRPTSGRGAGDAVRDRVAPLDTGGAADPWAGGATVPALSDGRTGTGQGAGGHRATSEGNAAIPH